MTSVPPPKPVTVRAIRERKGGERIVAVTAYDAVFGQLVDEAGVDLVLVGDSVGTAALGLDSTVSVTLQQIIHHAAAARRGVVHALLAVDMPFLSYQVSEERAIENCGSVLQQTGAQAVKLEGGGERIAGTIARLVEVGIPVIGHIGFTPQSVNTLGRNRVQARGDDGAEALLNDARRLEAAGVFAIVLELVPAAAAERVTRGVAVPTIGIGAGAGCDGQILVLPDLLGLNEDFSPRFLKRYANMAGTVRDAVRAYADDVRGGRYPAEEHSF